MDERVICSECLGLKPVARHLHGKPVCWNCVEKVMKDHDDKIETEKKRMIIEAKLMVIAEMERKLRVMQEEVLKEFYGLGLPLEEKVTLLVTTGNKMRAIMAYREATGKSIAESKEHIENIIDTLY